MAAAPHAVVAWDTATKIGTATLVIALCGVISWIADGLTIWDRLSGRVAAPTAPAASPTASRPAASTPEGSGLPASRPTSGRPDASSTAGPGSAEIVRTGGVGVQADVEADVITQASAGKLILLVRYESSGRTLYKRVDDVPNKAGTSSARHDIAGSKPCSERAFAVFHLPDGVTAPPGPTGRGSSGLPAELTILTEWYPHQRLDDPSEGCPD